MTSPDLDATQDDLLAEPTDNGPEDGAETPSQDPNWDPNEGHYDGPEL